MAETAQKRKPSAEIRRTATSRGFRAVSLRANNRETPLEGDAIELHVGVSKGWIVSVAALALTVIGSIVGWLSLREDKLEKRVVAEVRSEMRAVKAEVTADAKETMTHARLLISEGMTEIHEANLKLQKVVTEKQERLRNDLVHEIRKLRKSVEAEDGP